MKKFLAVLLAVMMLFSICVLAGCGETKDPDKKPDDGKKPDETGYKVAMITDYGDITDESFNQTTYEACVAFCKGKGYDFQYYKPAGDNTADRVAMIEKAINDGHNVIVMPGYAFAGAIVEAAPQYPNVKFFALDVAKGDLLEAGVTKAGEKYDYKPDNWDFDKYVNMSNVYSAIYQEELSGYMAGVAAVKLGYTKLGFLGGMEVPAVVRFGYGFVQGVNDAAKELGINVELNYVYGGQFYGDADITARMDTWYQNGTEIVFACGGGIYTSAGEAAVKKNGKLIGVDTDQKPVIDKKYGDGITVTSAMKGLYPTTIDTLKDIIDNGNWDNYKGKIANLGLVSGDDPTLNYVQLPMENTQWTEGKFTKDDYKALVKNLFEKKITVSGDTSKQPAVTNVKVDYQGTIKG